MSLVYFRMKSVTCMGSILLFFTLCAAKPAPYGLAKTSDPVTKIPSGTKPLLDYWMRDTYITLGNDGFYYLIGTTADPNRKFTGQMHCWDWNDGLYLFRSGDLSRWESLGLIWAHGRCGAWQQEPKIFADGEKFPKKSINGDPLDNRFHAVWAPELHYLKSQKNWFIVACLNNSALGSGSFILRSTSGKPEGPYENIEANAEKPLFDNIDGSLFEDEDGTVYFVGHNHFIARMKADMSGFDEPLTRLKETVYSKEPYIEGAYIFKHDGKYHLLQAIWSHRLPSGDETYCPETDDNKTRYSYDCIIATADHIYGPYSKRYNAITGGGHNNFFRDKTGQWWATIFFNPRGAQAKEYEQTCRPGIVPMKYRNGKFFPDNSRK